MRVRTEPCITFKTEEFDRGGRGHEILEVATSTDEGENKKAEIPRDSKAVIPKGTEANHSKAPWKLGKEEEQKRLIRS